VCVNIYVYIYIYIHGYIPVSTWLIHGVKGRIILLHIIDSYHARLELLELTHYDCIIYRAIEQKSLPQQMFTPQSSG